MVRLKMRLGPKGQVVIPQIFRKSYGLMPGSEVVIEDSENGVLIEKPTEDSIKLMRQIAAKGKQLTRIDSDKDWEEEMEERWKKIEEHT